MYLYLFRKDYPKLNTPLAILHKLVGQNKLPKPEFTVVRCSMNIHMYSDWSCLTVPVQDQFNFCESRILSFQWLT